MKLLLTLDSTALHRCYLLDLYWQATGRVNYRMYFRIWVLALCVRNRLSYKKSDLSYIFHKLTVLLFTVGYYKLIRQDVQTRRYSFFSKNAPSDLLDTFIPTLHTTV